MKPENLQPVKYIGTIAPENIQTDDKLLVYPRLAERVSVQNEMNGKAISWALSTSPESRCRDVADVSSRQMALEEIRHRRLINAADRIVNGQDPDLVSLHEKRFRGLSERLYGYPDYSVAENLLRDELANLYEFATEEEKEVIDRVVKNLNYESAGPGSEKEELERFEIDPRILQELNIAINERFGYLFEDIDDDDVYDVDSIAQTMARSIEILAENENEAWLEWSVVVKEATSIMVGASDKQIVIPEDRPPISGKKMKGLLAHELLVHAQRSVLGETHQVEGLNTGLAGFISGEEGLAAISEQAISGEEPLLFKDRYIDIALAFAVGENGTSLSRPQIIEFVQLRDKLRLRSLGLSDELTDARRKDINKHVGRIYRGGRGDAGDKLHPVYSKDFVYFDGYMKVAAYISKMLEDGHLMPDIYNFLIQGGFDPTNELHLKLLEEAPGISVIR